MPCCKDRQAGQVAQRPPFHSCWGATWAASPRFLLASPASPTSHLAQPLLIPDLQKWGVVHFHCGFSLSVLGFLVITAGN